MGLLLYLLAGLAMGRPVFMRQVWSQIYVPPMLVYTPSELLVEAAGSESAATPAPGVRGVVDVGGAQGGEKQEGPGGLEGRRGVARTDSDRNNGCIKSRRRDR